MGVDDMNKIRTAVRLAFMFVVLVEAGCATHVKFAPTVLAPPAPVTHGGEVAVAHEAEGVPTDIGKATITVFAIPASAVRFDEPNGAEQIMSGMRDALRAAGYDPVTAADPPRGPMLACRITEMHFKNYTWFMPMIQTWGTIRLGLSLTDPGGAIRWQKDYEGKYDGNGVNESFDKAVNVAMGKILTRAAEDFTTPEFRAACCDATGR